MILASIPAGLRTRLGAPRGTSVLLCSVSEDHTPKHVSGDSKGHKGATTDLECLLRSLQSTPPRKHHMVKGSDFWVVLVAEKSDKSNLRGEGFIWAIVQMLVCHDDGVSQP